MRRSKPTNKLDVIGNLCLTSEDDRAQGFKDSKKNESLLFKPPGDNCGVNSIEQMAIDFENEHQAMLKLQKEMQVSQERLSLIDADRAVNLKKMFHGLRQRFIETNNFLHSCSKRQKTALKVISEEKMKHVEFKNDIGKLKKDIDVLQKFHSTLSKTVAELEPYERVLKETAAEDEVFTSVEDCLYRCDALMLAQAEILKMREAKLVEIDKIRKEMARKTNEASTAILGMSITLNELDKGLKTARANCAHYEGILINIKNTTRENELDKKRFYDAINDMYRLICRKKKNNPDKVHLEERLQFIRDEIIILQGVLKECEKES